MWLSVRLVARVVHYCLPPALRKIRLRLTLRITYFLARTGGQECPPHATRPHRIRVGMKTNCWSWYDGLILIAIFRVRPTTQFSRCCRRVLLRGVDATALISIAIASIANCARGAARGWRQSPAAVLFLKLRCSPWLRSLREWWWVHSTKILPWRAMRATSCCWATPLGGFAAWRVNQDAYWLKTRTALRPRFPSGSERRRREPKNSRCMLPICGNRSATACRISRRSGFPSAIQSLPGLFH